MRVVLRDDVEHLGHKGDLVDVRDGYARNFLVPRGLAMQANAGVVRQAEAMRRSREVREERARDAARAQATAVTGRPVQVEARAGEGGKLFGSVTAADVVEAVAAQLGVEIDRRKLDLAEPLKELGPAEVTVRLHPDVVAHLSVEVVAAE
jgi:large subunit ribosomal protein L9